MQNSFFISAIGTDVGKTVVSAIFLTHLKASFWKPIQCGTPTDSDQIRKWLPEVKIFPERYLLKTPASPHFAAEREQVNIQLADFTLPKSDGYLIIEGAGGLLVPINQTETQADLISHLNIPVVLVVRHYLGSINHSLLTISEIHRREIPLAGIVFIGTDFQDAETIILSHSNAKCLFRLPEFPEINAKMVVDFSLRLDLNI